MDRTHVNVIHRVFEDYNKVSDVAAKGYFLADDDQGVYTIIIIPEADHPSVGQPGMILLARTTGDYIVIERDSADRPLVNALKEAGIPRQQIILTYAGEQLPDSIPA